MALTLTMTTTSASSSIHFSASSRPAPLAPSSGAAATGAAPSAARVTARIPTQNLRDCMRDPILVQKRLGRATPCGPPDSDLVVLQGILDHVGGDLAGDAHHLVPAGDPDGLEHLDQQV